MIIKSLDHLKLFIKKFGSRLIKCNCIYLYGEIGAGKTTLVKSLINSLQEKNMIKKLMFLVPHSIYYMSTRLKIKKFYITIFTDLRIKKKLIN